MNITIGLTFQNMACIEVSKIISQIALNSRTGKVAGLQVRKTQNHIWLILKKMLIVVSGCMPY